jgi:methyl-accepting chemotaxis protein
MMRSNDETQVSALLKIAEALEHVSSSIDELARNTEPVDNSDVARAIKELGTFSDVLYQCSDVSGLKLAGDIGVTKND